jgi:hypothetical protein
MKSLLIRLCLAFALLPVAGPILAASSANKLAIEDKLALCEAEGQLALHMARTYFMNGRKADQLLTSKTDSEANLQLVLELVEKVGSGEVKHYADFATERLYACAKRVDLVIDKPTYLARACYARVDIPHFLYLFKQTGSNKDAAISKVTSMLKDRNVYPESLIGIVADMVYTVPPQEPYERLLNRIFWTCLYNEEIKK